MSEREDLEHCASAIRQGSYSFHAASKMLPRRVRDRAFALYAFCRLADDEVDLVADPAASVARLRVRLDLCYSGRPLGRAEDRAFTWLIEDTEIPRALPEALLEGLDWDAQGLQYQTISELRAYSARVASSVGVMMCVLMGVRDRHALARASDLGVAMQLTNIARDVGEDARAGRIYLPMDWLEEAGLQPGDLLLRPGMSGELKGLIRQLVAEAETLYIRSEPGIRALPVDCRPGIFAARYVYAGIGGQLRRLGYDSINHRARTSTGQKVGLLLRAGLRATLSAAMPLSPVIYAKPLPETEFLVSAAAMPDPGRKDHSETLLETFAVLKARDRAIKRSLLGEGRLARTAP